MPGLPSALRRGFMGVAMRVSTLTARYASGCCATAVLRCYVRQCYVLHGAALHPQVGRAIQGTCAPVRTRLRGRPREGGTAATLADRQILSCGYGGTPVWVDAESVGSRSGHPELPTPLRSPRRRSNLCSDRASCLSERLPRPARDTRMRGARSSGGPRPAGRRPHSRARAHKLGAAGVLGESRTVHRERRRRQLPSIFRPLKPLQNGIFILWRGVWRHLLNACRGTAVHARVGQIRNTRT